MTQARALRDTRSPATGLRYPVRMILAVYDLPPSTFYDRCASRPGVATPMPRAKPGPKTTQDDATLLAAIRDVIATSPFSGEGYRKVRARLVMRGLRVSRNRVHRLMRLHGLLAPTRRRHSGAKRVHDGTIITPLPNQCWGGDATEVVTTQNGTVTIFDLIDHCTDEILGVTVTTTANRFAALDCLHQAVRREFGTVGKDAARGVTLRCDHGSQFTSARYVNEANHLGCSISYAFVGQPECNGVIERWHRTLKEQLLWTRTWQTADEVRDAVLAFVQRYNQHWLIQRHGHRSPSTVRASFRTTVAA